MNFAFGLYYSFFYRIGNAKDGAKYMTVGCFEKIHCNHPKSSLVLVFVTGRSGIPCLAFLSVNKSRRLIFPPMAACEFCPFFDVFNENLQLHR